MEQSDVNPLEMLSGPGRDTSESDVSIGRRGFLKAQFIICNNHLVSEQEAFAHG